MIIMGVIGVIVLCASMLGWMLHLKGCEELCARDWAENGEDLQQLPRVDGHQTSSNDSTGATGSGSCTVTVTSAV